MRLPETTATVNTVIAAGAGNLTTGGTIAMASIRLSVHCWGLSFDTKKVLSSFTRLIYHNLYME